MKTISNAEIEGKRVFLRVDFNVPILDSVVLNDFKITSVLPTIRLLHSRNPRRVIIGSHLGRPKGKYSKELSLRPVYSVLKARLWEELGVELDFCDLWDVGNVQSPWILLENLRFYSAEEDAGDKDAVDQYRNVFVDNMDVAVIDAFGCLHRECGSIQRTGLPSFSGLLVQKELNFTKEIMEERVDLMILGGKKVSDKIKLLESLGQKTGSLFVTGGLAFPFIRYILGKEVGKSIGESVSEEEVKRIHKICEEHKTRIILPSDFTVVCNDSVQTTSNIPPEGSAMDIGPETIEMLRREVSKAKAVFWNGPPGMYEEQSFSRGTEALVSALESLKGEGKKSFCGGGETAGAIRLFGSYDAFTYVSTGGGVLMKLLGGKRLPGLDFLSMQP
ncbi:PHOSPHOGLYCERATE KINASE [Encephalitozoon cuniculi GB-M1]|uniref:Phosphoglycerate kinase n=1 Tax=Encephalitozoon cuniculi (strain GB-M1) TaxID=284813 RepID=Q8SRZ8_ENCCU|nr:phosphoglycerate kinase [Encephalitozoon cuniculi GB-M1]KMV66085.1 phosphoglycerate kinase [Encephalitozoon cuniculi EcunIII-L]UYI27820.1 phosphoglycerate kinase [Encephalitozoon cuniculi]CAD26549.1 PHOSPHOGLYCERATE KINASE [Encephalitozoon cuniculi GB-M1]